MIYEQSCNPGGKSKKLKEMKAPGADRTRYLAMNADIAIARSTK